MYRIQTMSNLFNLNVFSVTILFHFVSKTTVITLSCKITKHNLTPLLCYCLVIQLFCYIPIDNMMASKSVVIVSFAILLFGIFVEDACGWRMFWKGRRRGGNLLSPDKARKQLPPDEWFEQNLDHFNESNKETWQQVIVF